jgi:predicted DNA-binding ribbon-helix-helix protein
MTDRVIETLRESKAKELFSCRISPPTTKTLQRIAKREKVTVSKLGAAILEDFAKHQQEAGN